MNLLSTLIGPLAQRIAAAIAPRLQTRLSQSAQGLRSGSNRTPSFLTWMGGKSSGSGFLQRMATLVQSAPSRTVNGRGGVSSARGSSPARAGSSPGLLERLGDIRGRLQMRRDQKQSGQSWWKRGWGTQANGQKHSALSRAARLKEIAQKRYQRADRAVKASASKKNTPGWHPAAHGKLLASRKAAQQKLSQATALQAKATGLGAGAAGRVAGALSGLAGKLPMLASKLALPISIAAAVVKIPFALSRMNDARINALREGARYNGAVAAAIARYDVKSENIKALNARDTAASTSWLVDQQNSLRSTLRPFQAGMANAVNYLQGGATWGLNQYAKFEQKRLDWMGAIGKELVDLIPGAGGDGNFNLGDIKKNVDQMAKDRDAQAKADQLVFSKQMTQHLGGYKDALYDARWNNRRKINPLPRIR